MARSEGLLRDWSGDGAAHASPCCPESSAGGDFLPAKPVTHPGVFCLRSSETEWDEDALRRTYTTLTDVEAVFRSLKSELGLRPIYHQKPRRADGHLFITVIAYQLMQVIRTQLRAHRNSASWTTLRRILEGKRRVTATRRPDVRTLHVLMAAQAEPRQRERL